MKNKTKILLSSLAMIAVAGTVSAGSTAALFSDKDEANIAISSGKVDVSARAEVTALYSALAKPEYEALTEKPTVETVDEHIVSNLAEDGYLYYNKLMTGTFATGGTAVLTGNTLALTNVVAGDKAVVTISIDDDSNVSVKYRYVVECTSTELDDLEFFTHLDFTLNGTKYTNFKKYTSSWVEKDPSDDIDDIVLSLQVPVTSREMDKKCAVKIYVEAVQGNAYVEGEAEASFFDIKKTVVTNDEDDGLENFVMTSGTVVENESPKDMIIISVPASLGHILSGEESLASGEIVSLKVEEVDDVVPTIVVAENDKTMNYEISLLNESNEKITSVEEEIKVQIYVGNKNVTAVYHDGQPVAYTIEDGYVTIMTKDFSPYTICYNNDRVANKSYGFFDSYQADDGHWIHEIDSAAQFKSIVIPNAKASDLADLAGLRSSNTEYFIVNNISFENKTPWSAMELTSSEWESYLFTGKLVGKGEQKVFSDSILEPSDIASLSSNELIGNLFCKVGTCSFENLEFSNFKSEGAKAATGLVVGGNEVAVGLRHIDTVTVKNVTIDENCTITGSKNTGAFAGSVRYFDRVDVEDYINNANVTCTSYGAAGFAGTATGLKILNMNRCTNYGKMSADQGRASGFIGAISGVSATPTENQTKEDGFTLTNCNSFGTLRDNSPKTSQGGGFFVGLQNATDSDAYSDECSNNSIAAGVLYTTLSTSITCNAERGFTWINEHDSFDSHVESFSLENLNLQIDVVNHTVTVGNPSQNSPSYYTFQIAVDCMKLGADFTTKTCWEIESKIKTVYTSGHYATVTELESSERMISTMGFFMAQKDGVTIERGDVSKYVHVPQTKLQEFVIAEEFRGQPGYTEEFSRGEDGNYRFILLNETCENNEFIGVNRMGTRVHYIVSAFDAGGNKIGGSEYTQMIYNGTDENVRSILPTNGFYQFYRNYEW